MKKGSLYFVSFEPIKKYRCYLSMNAVINGKKDLEPLLSKASDIYEHAITRMNFLIAEINAVRSKRKPVTARKIWDVGDAIFTLRDELGQLGLELDGVYDHLTRDLGVKRKWLEKVIILRRYLPNKEPIPESLNWGRCEKGTRRVAEQIKSGLQPS